MQFLYNSREFADNLLDVLIYYLGLRCYLLTNFELNGTQVNYYFVCKRKLWLFSHGITFESGSDLVKIGRLIDKDSFKRKKKNIRIGNIAIDHIEDRKSTRLNSSHPH